MFKGHGVRGIENGYAKIKDFEHPHSQGRN